jgi:hypothetical protein
MSLAVPSPVPPGSTGPSSKVVAWTSFVIDTRNSKIYSVFNGGHTDYSGNEVDMFDPENETPHWVQTLAPTSTAQIIDDADYYGDGRPTSRHTYYGAVYVEQTNKAMTFGGAKWSVFGSGTHAVDHYDSTTNTCSTAGSHPDVPIDLYTSGDNPAVSKDPSTGDIYFIGGYVAYAWRRATNTWENLGDGISCYSTASAFDSTRRRMLMVGSDRNAHHHFAVDTNVMTSITLSGSAAAAVQAQGQAGMVYVSEIDKFLLITASGGGTVYQINPSTFECSVFATTGGSGVQATVNGPYNKVLYSPRMKSIYYFPTYDQNPWVLRVVP